MRDAAPRAIVDASPSTKDASMLYGESKEVPFSALAGRTLTEVRGLEKGSGAVTFVCDNGDEFRLFHYQNCCESVAVEDVTGNVADLIGSPVRLAEEASNRDGDPKPGEYAESWTWTFYKLATMKGYVDVRWLGESNGYYSEGVSFVQDKVGA